MKWDLRNHLQFKKRLFLQLYLEKTSLQKQKQVRVKLLPMASLSFQKLTLKMILF